MSRGAGLVGLLCMAERAATIEGRIVVVTGANSGIGFESARGLATLGASVVMVCRDPARGAEARDAIARELNRPPPTLLLADLAEQAQVRRLAAELRDQLPRIDVLINNAGAAFPKRGLTVDGIERTFAVNHLAPFLLTTLLLDRIREAPQGRVVAVSSDLHAATIDFDDLQMERDYSWIRAYALSKLGNVLFTKELARRFAGSTATANALEPGPALSHFGRGAGGTLGVVARLLQAAAFFGIAGSTEDGARTPIYLASSPEVSATTGKYFRKCREVAAKPITDDADVARRLWEASERMCMTATAVAGVTASTGTPVTRVQ
jgi:NAD(P)-dependent dehydrogenase (short-subunit alcohol dehydrogenase family)